MRSTTCLRDHCARPRCLTRTVPGQPLVQTARVSRGVLEVAVRTARRIDAPIAEYAAAAFNRAYPEPGPPRSDHGAGRADRDAQLAAETRIVVPEA